MCALPAVPHTTPRRLVNNSNDGRATVPGARWTRGNSYKERGRSLLIRILLPQNELQSRTPQDVRVTASTRVHDLSLRVIRLPASGTGGWVWNASWLAPYGSATVENSFNFSIRRGFVSRVPPLHSRIDNSEWMWRCESMLSEKDWISARSWSIVNAFVCPWYFFLAKVKISEFS